MVATASSEETPTEDPMGGEGYSVAFDPLVRFLFFSFFFGGGKGGPLPRVVCLLA